MARNLGVVLALGLIGFAGIASAQECHPATPAEKAAVMKVIDTAKTAIEAPLVAGDWRVDSDHTGEDTAIATKSGPPRPLMACTHLFDVGFELKPDTPRGKAHYAKAEAALKNAANVGAFHELDLGRFQVSISENSPYLREEQHVPMARLDVPGTAVAYRLTHQPREPNDDPDVSTCLKFGDWSKFPWATNKYIPYPFVHPMGTPYIETLTVCLTGLPETVDPILKQIDWSRLTQALSR